MKPESTNEKSPRLVHKLAIAGGVVVLGFGLAACGGSSDSSSTPAPQTSSETPTGGSVAGVGQLPAGWPSDVPTPPNTTVAGGAGANGSFSASFKGSGSLDSELDSYFGELKSNGWTQDKTVDTGKNLTGWNKDNRRVQVIGQDEGNGEYHINVTVVTKNAN